MEEGTGTRTDALESRLSWDYLKRNSRLVRRSLGEGGSGFDAFEGP